MKAYVNGIRRQYVTQSLSFKKSTNARPTGQISFINEGTAFVKGGSRVDIYDKNDIHVFGGYARKPKVKKYRDFMITQVDLVDNQDITDRRLVAESYIQEIDYDIIQDIYNRYLKDEGIKLGVIASNYGDTVTEIKRETTKTDFETGVISGLDVSVGGQVTLRRVEGNPAIRTVSDNFSTDSNAFGMSYRGDNGDEWYRTNSVFSSGGYSLRSPRIDDREYTEAFFSVSVRPGAIGRFKTLYRVSSEKLNDYFNIWLVKSDQPQWERIHRDSGTETVWKEFEYILPEGDYQIVFEYKKDRNNDDGDDCVYIDSVSFEELEGLVYNPKGYRTSPSIISTRDVIKSIKIDVDAFIPEGTSVNFRYSVDSGDSWRDVQSDNLVSQSVNGQTGVIIEMSLNTNDTTTTPAVNEVTYHINTTTGTLVQKAVFNYIPISQALDEISELSGAVWWITPDKHLNYVTREEFRSPWELLENESPVSKLEVEMDMNNYRNVQYVRAGQDTTDLQTETFVGDGSRHTFTVGFAIAEEPTITLNGVSQTIGIRGKDINKMFYWAKGEKEITVDSSIEKLKHSDVVTILYKGFYPIIAISQDTHAIETMKSNSDGTGIYEYVDDNQAIDDSELALEFANSKLRRFAKVNTRIKFQTVEPGLEVGQLLPVNLPGYGINGEFLITSVSIKPFDNDFIFYDVECVDGEDVGGWETFFKQLAKSQKTFVIRENEILIRSVGINEDVVTGENISMISFACKLPSNDLFPSETFYPC